MYKIGFSALVHFFGQLPLNFVYELIIKRIGLGLDKFGIVDG